MKFLSRSSFWITTLAFVVLSGAGCASAPVPAPVPASSAETPAVTPSPLPVIDATWKTYTNGALGFSFRYPTRGTYAPTWKMILPGKNDPKITNGCYSSVESIPNGEAPRNLTIDGVTFCHTRAGDGFTGHIGYEDNYLVQLNGQWVLFSFEKTVTNGSMYDAEQYPACQGKYVTSPCVEFNETDYLAHLDQIVGTFKKLK